jgi:CBS domain-containing protein
MTQLVKDVMTGDPVCLGGNATMGEAAKAMRDHDIGDVLVVDGSRLIGIITDRDLVVRAVANGQGPDDVRLSELATTNAAVIGPDEPAEHAVRVMREHAIRRLAVCDGGGAPIGMVSIGDLAQASEAESALADVSAERPNN